MYNYKSIVPSSNGYEDIIDELKKYTKQEYLSSGEQRKQEMINEVFDLYRSKNIFPITYYNKWGIRDEIKKMSRQASIF